MSTRQRSTVYPYVFEIKKGLFSVPQLLGLNEITRGMYTGIFYTTYRETIEG
jgi:hypothetical protein